MAGYPTQLTKVKIINRDYKGHAVIEPAARKFIGRTRTAKRRVGRSWYA